jgi:hypothetical protein
MQEVLEKFPLDMRSCQRMHQMEHAKLVQVSPVMFLKECIQEKVVVIGSPPFFPG